MSETLGSAAALQCGSSSMSFYFRYCFSPAEGASPYPRDLQNVDMHMLDTGHFALETHGKEIASRIEEFIGKQKLAEDFKSLVSTNLEGFLYVFGEINRDL